MFFIFGKTTKNHPRSHREQQTRHDPTVNRFVYSRCGQSLSGLICCLLALVPSSTAWSQESHSTSTTLSDLAAEFSSPVSQDAAGPLLVAPVTLSVEEYNPYDDSQLESLVQQGRIEQEAGNHREAAELFAMAWQSSRVTNGLYHVGQMPLLESMIVSEIELEDWQAVDDRYAYIELLFTRLYDKQDARLEAGLQAVSSWHVNAFNLNLDGKREQHLRKAYKLLKLRLEVAANTLPPDDPKFAFLTESIRLSETYIYLMSNRYQEQLRKQERSERERLLATLD